MGQNGHWIPDKEADFVAFCKTWLRETESEAAAAKYGWPKEAVTTLRDSLTDFLEKRAAYLTNDSTANRDAKNAAQKTAREACRYFARFFIRSNVKMSVVERARFGVKERDPMSAPMMEVNSYPMSQADTSILRQVIFHFWDSVTGKRGKSRRIHGAEICWAILDHQPTSIEELVHSDFDTASPLTLRFDERMRGKWLYYAFRWETNTNVKGPFGPIGSVIIP